MLKSQGLGSALRQVYCQAVCPGKTKTRAALDEFHLALFTESAEAAGQLANHRIFPVPEPGHVELRFPEAQAELLCFPRLGNDLGDMQ